MACVDYWANKLRREGRAESLLETMVRFDISCMRWHDMETELGLIGKFGHLGQLHEKRKPLSYYGNPDVSPSGRDLGNWTYAVCMRTMLTDFKRSDWRRRGTEQLNDESAGDIMEAIWGLLYHRTTNGPLMDKVSEESISNTNLSAYCQIMTSVVLLFQDYHIDFLVRPEWPDSRTMADMLV